VFNQLIETNLYIAEYVAKGTRAQQLLGWPTVE